MPNAMQGVVQLLDPRVDPLVALLVEDSPSDAEVIIERLASASSATPTAPVRLIHASSVAAALVVLREATPDVVILDLSLPDAHGLEALRRVRAAAPGAPVIVLSGMADQAIALEALRAGAQDYVLKPPPDGHSLVRILRYARERQLLVWERDAALRESATAAQRWRLLAEVGRVLAESNEPERVIPGLASILVPDAADCFVVYLVGDGDVPTIIEVAHVNRSRELKLRVQVRQLLDAKAVGVDRPSDELPTARATNAGDLEGITPLLFDVVGVESGAVVPLRLGGRMRGLVALAITAGRRDTAADDEFASLLADRTTLALERARLYRQAQRAAAARDRAVSIVSHDLGNPLSTIEICAAALLDPEPQPLSGVRSMAQIIQRSAAWMRHIVQDLLDRASLDAGRLMLDRRPTTVSDVVGAAQVLFAPAAEERALEFVVESGIDLPRVDADASRLVQVLSNLLSNAMKFTPTGGRVVLSARVVPEEAPDASSVGGRADVRFTVSDTGPGIPKDEQPHIFDWFWHAPSGGRGGTGLGLAIAKGLVEAHRGRLNVESVPGHGSTFWFTLPSAGGEA